VVGDGLLTASNYDASVCSLLTKEYGRRGEQGRKDPSKLVLGSVIVGSIHRDSAKGKEGAREQAAIYLANKVRTLKARRTFCSSAPV